MARPDLSRVFHYYHGYIGQVKEDDLIKAFTNQTASFLQFLDSIPVAKRSYAYAEGKWTIQEVLQHIIDAERVFAYRALCFARQDKTPLPSFDENSYAENSKASTRKWDDLVEEFKAVRLSSEIMFRSFDNDQLESNGVANNKPVYVLGIGFVLVGHAEHHVNVIKERYL
ncbi:MAG TPA: DinB family protein [Chitinophagaceae bacterium]|nr:DinB family protein [Chitinophagaceae bacterium]